MSDFAPWWMLQDVEPSFRVPLADPGVAPDASPTVWIPVNPAWLPILGGCALQAAIPASWVYANQTELFTLMQYATTLINLILDAESTAAMIDGTQAITILAGNGQSSAVVTFSLPFLNPPKVLVGSDTVGLDATVDTITTTGCTLHLAASVPVIVNTTGTVTWVALQ